MPLSFAHIAVFLAALPGLCACARGQSLDTFLRDLPTSELIQQPGWWPTKPLRPSEQAQLAGWQSCAKCHSSLVNSQRQTGMSHALMPADASVIRNNTQKITSPALPHNDGLSTNTPSMA
jgi:hypothetical protein